MRLTSEYGRILEDYAEDKYPKYITEMNKMKKRVGEDQLDKDLHTEIKQLLNDKKNI